MREWRLVLCAPWLILSCVASAPPQDKPKSAPAIVAQKAVYFVDPNYEGNAYADVLSELKLAGRAAGLTVTNIESAADLRVAYSVNCPKATQCVVEVDATARGLRLKRSRLVVLRYYYQTPRDFGERAAVEIVNEVTQSQEVQSHFADARTSPGAEQLVSVLLLEMKALGPVPSGSPPVATRILAAELQQLGTLRVVLIDDVEAALGLDKQQALLGCEQSSCVAEIGRSLGVDYVAHGQLGAMGGKYSLNLTAVSSRDGVAKTRISEVLPASDESLVGELPRIAAQFATALLRKQ